MSEHSQAPQSKEDAALEREIREGRKFTLEEAIARLAGPGSMKGESPVPRIEQAANEIQSWLRVHLVDSGGALEAVLQRHVRGSELLLNNFDHPLVVLAGCCQRILDSDYFLSELVRAADIEWGRVMGERPYFQRAGSEPNADDPYTADRVRGTLSELLKQLAADIK